MFTWRACGRAISFFGSAFRNTRSRALSQLNLYAGKIYRTRASYFVAGVVSATFSLPGVESLVR
jgi:hypothetical protein